MVEVPGREVAEIPAPDQDPAVIICYWKETKDAQTWQALDSSLNLVELTDEQLPEAPKE